MHRLRPDGESVNMAGPLLVSGDRTIIVPYVLRVFPMVEEELGRWRALAASIPDRVLCRQALDSIEHKRFHCQGGSIYALYHGAKCKELTQFIVALQTISDYLDNLCDRVPEAGEQGFRLLHCAMTAAVDTHAALSDWYGEYPYHNDGGYLDALVKTCRDALLSLPGYTGIRDELSVLAGLYSDLQVYKHIDIRARVDMLTRWFSRHNSLVPPDIKWWEFAAATGSTLGIFSLAALAAGGPVSHLDMDSLLSAYFPWLCGLHILLDYFIDLDEDREHGDLNFVAHYPSLGDAEEGIYRFLTQSLQKVNKLPRPVFHRTVIKGLLALYLSDPKSGQPRQKKIAQRLLKKGGTETYALYTVCRALRKKGTI